MIAPSSGEVGFAGGLRIAPHLLMFEVLSALPNTARTARKTLPIKGWSQYWLGIHASSFGTLEVETSVGPEVRVEAAFLSHHHSFYERSDQDDTERRAFHEGIISIDLRGQREFSWGHVFCTLDKGRNRSWLVVVYSPFAAVPLREQRVDMILAARGEISQDGI